MYNVDLPHLLMTFACTLDVTFCLHSLPSPWRLPGRESFCAETIPGKFLRRSLDQRFGYYGTWLS